MIATLEHWPLENGLGEYLIAPARSWIKTLQERKGKTVASNATNGGCDLMIRDHIRAAGILASAMKMVVIPFPQMKGALELGTVDAVCAVDPFYAAIMASSLSARGADGARVTAACRNRWRVVASSILSRCMSCCTIGPAKS